MFAQYMYKMVNPIISSYVLIIYLYIDLFLLKMRKVVRKLDIARVRFIGLSEYISIYISYKGRCLSTPPIWNFAVCVVVSKNNSGGLVALSFAFVFSSVCKTL
jgi:hypothetical protein